MNWNKGAVSFVSGCYDRSGDLTGTVSGNILRASGLTDMMERKVCS